MEALDTFGEVYGLNETLAFGMSSTDLLKNCCFKCLC